MAKPIPVNVPWQKKKFGLTWRVSHRKSPPKDLNSVPSGTAVERTHWSDVSSVLTPDVWLPPSYPSDTSEPWKLKDPPSLCSEERVPLDVEWIVIAHVLQWGLMGTVRTVIHLIHFGNWACAGKKNSYPWLLGNSLWSTHTFKVCESTFKACENKFYFWQDVKKKNHIYRKWWLRF